MKMFVAGKWVDKPEQIEVRNPFDGTVIDTVPKADARPTSRRRWPAAVEGARDHACDSADTSASRSCKRAAELIGQRQREARPADQHRRRQDPGRGRCSKSRARARRSSCRPKRPSGSAGEVLPLDGAPGGAGKLGFTLRVPCGVVAAITPFNFPLNLVCHKVGPALAAGNAVILKPASDTPLSALALVEILLEAGLPPLAISCLTGSGGTIGDALAADPRVRKISFTGSRDVGEHICKVAGIKKVTMELGSNSPLIVMPDADLDKVAAGHGGHRLFQRRPGLHLDAAGDRARQGL